MILHFIGLITECCEPVECSSLQPSVANTETTANQKRFMKNNTTATTATSTPNLPVCAVCKETGRQGALWNFFVGDSQTPTRVHKPCGELLQKQAPEGVRTALVPSPTLREEWRKQRLAKQAKGLWDTAFANARPLAKPAVQPAICEPAPALAA